MVKQRGYAQEDIMSMTKKAVALMTAFLMVLALAAAAIPAVQAFAEQGSSSVLFKGRKQISGSCVISDSQTVPEGSTLYVRKGGKLYIKSGAELILNGTLKVAAGGAVYVKGQLTAGDTAMTSVTGKVKVQKDGVFAQGGTLRVNKGGSVFGLGTLEVVNDFADIICKGSVKAKIKAPAPVEKDGVTTIGGVIIVNRQFDLPKDYGDGLDEETYNAYLKMRESSGYDMSIVSGFRSYEKQKATFAYWASIDGPEVADTYSAQPGHSEHQTGLAMDISSLKQSYGETAEGKWLAEHCWEYGFLLRYPKGSEHITGYIYEPWHVRYLGTSTAKLLHDSGLTLEEFLGVA